MITKEILEEMSLKVDHFVDKCIDPWNLPVKVILKKYDGERGWRSKEYNILCLSCNRYNYIIITEEDKPMSLKEFLMCMSAKSEERYWYVHKVFGSGNTHITDNAYIARIDGYCGTDGSGIYIVAEDSE